MAILVTGGLGNVGTFVAKALLERDQEVVLYDSASPTSALDILITPEQNKRVTRIRGDILDLPLLVRTAKQHKVRKIIHLAVAVTSITDANPAYGCRVIVEGTNNVFETALAVEVERVVWASSVMVFGPRSMRPDGIVENDGPFDPQTIYGSCKLVNERTSLHYADAFGLDAIGLRLPSVYGAVAADSYVRWIPQAISALVRGLPASVPWNDREISMVYVEDMVRGIWQALLAKKAGPMPIYTMPGIYATHDDIYQVLRSYFPAGSIAVDRPPKGVDQHPPDRKLPRYDPTAAKKALGWECSTSISDGIGRIIRYHRTLHANSNASDANRPGS